MVSELSVSAAAVASAFPLPLGCPVRRPSAPQQILGALASPFLEDGSFLRAARTGHDRQF